MACLFLPADHGGCSFNLQKERPIVKIFDFLFKKTVGVRVSTKFGDWKIRLYCHQSVKIELLRTLKNISSICYITHTGT